jgi:hypothetical protein
MPNRKKSSESMIIDDYEPSPDDEFNIRDNDPLPEELALLPKLTALSDDDRYVTNRDFNYTMHLMDNKINSLYKLCRYISDQQQQSTKSLTKLVALDELSDGFWNVSYLRKSIFILIVN